MASSRNRSSSQLNKLEGGKYNFNRLNYPSDGLASEKIPNYIIFYINVPESATYNKNTVRSSDGGVELSNSDKLTSKTRGNNPTIASLTPEQMTASYLAFAAAQSFMNGQGNPITQATKAGRGIGGVFLRVGAVSSMLQTIEKKPKYNRIRSAIAMYMPDTIVHSFAHDYDVASIRDAAGNLGLAARGGEGLFDAVFGDTPVNVANNPGLAEALGRIGEGTGLVGRNFTELALRGEGKAINPQLEMVYKQTRNRGFIFNFKMQPRSSLESRNIKNIIREFKRYSAPSLAGQQEDASYFTIPGQFDIQFMFRNEENRFIGRISSCILEAIDIDYVSSGQFATFDDGSPVEISLQLRFVEVDTLTKEVFEDDNGGVNNSYNDGPSF